MGLFDFFKKSQEKIESDHRSNILLAVKIFESNPDENWETLCDKLVSKLGSKKLAYDLYRFLPIAYCRQFLPEVNFPDTYKVMKSESNFEEHKFADSKLYREVEEIVAKKLKNINSQGDIMSVLIHSSEFDAINNALKDGSKLEDVVISPPIFT